MVFGGATMAKKPAIASRYKALLRAACYRSSGIWFQSIELEISKVKDELKAI